MNALRILSILSLSSLIFHSALAEDANPGDLAEPGEYAAWEIKIEKLKVKKDKDALPEANPKDETGPTRKHEDTENNPRKIVVTTTAGLQREVFHWKEGRKTEVWSAGHYKFLRYPGKIQIADMHHPDVKMSYRDPWSDTGFLGTNWIKAKMFQGKERLKGKKLFLYTNKKKVKSSEGTTLRNGADPRYGSPEGSDTGNAAWIHPETMLPAQVHYNGYKLEYKHLSKPTAMLTLPDDIKRRWERYKVRMGIQ